MRKKCSDKIPLNQAEKPGKCMKRGIGVGMNLPVKVTMDWSKDMLRAVCAKLKVPRYSSLSKQQLHDAILSKGFDKYNIRELIN